MLSASVRRVATGNPDEVRVEVEFYGNGKIIANHAVCVIPMSGAPTWQRQCREALNTLGIYEPR